MQHPVSYGCAAPIWVQVECRCSAQVLRSSMYPSNNCMNMCHELGISARAFCECVTKAHNMRVETCGPGVLSSLVGLVIAKRLLAKLGKAAQKCMVLKCMSFRLSKDDGIGSSVQELPVHDVPQVSVGAQIKMFPQGSVL